VAYGNEVDSKEKGEEIPDELPEYKNNNLFK